MIMKRLHSLILSAIATLAATLPAPAQIPSVPLTRPAEDCPAGQIPTPAQGQQPVTRYQFAAGLDTCLNQVTQPLQRGNFATKTELNQLTQRQQELNQELRQLRDRLDASDPPQRANP